MDPIHQVELNCKLLKWRSENCREGSSSLTKEYFLSWRRYCTIMRTKWKKLFIMDKWINSLLLLFNTRSSDAPLSGLMFPYYSELTFIHFLITLSERVQECIGYLIPACRWNFFPTIPISTRHGFPSLSGINRRSGPRDKRGREKSQMRKKEMNYWECMAKSEKERRESIACCLATVKLLLPSPSSASFLPPFALCSLRRVQSIPFIMTMPVSLTKDDPSCGYKLPQDPHIGFLASPPRDLTIPSYLTLNARK